MNTNIPTVDEYLQLDDWKFELSMKKGCHGEFFWLRSGDLRVVDLLQVIDVPDKPFRVLVSYWDWSGGGASTYGNDEGWRKLGEFAISDYSVVLPKLHYGADNAQMLVDHAILDDQLLAALTNFSEPNLLEELGDEQARSFWATMEAIRPYCYFSYGFSDGLTFVTRGAEIYKQFFDRLSLLEVEAIHKNNESARRRNAWNALGPECGPERCIEPDCERLRIRLAVRCFLHQLRWK